MGGHAGCGGTDTRRPLALMTLVAQHPNPRLLLLGEAGPGRTGTSGFGLPPRHVNVASEPCGEQGGFVSISTSGRLGRRVNQIALTFGFLVCVTQESEIIYIHKNINIQDLN